MATVLFMKMIISMTDADTDQEHIPMLVRHSPFIPDRTAYILDGTKENPVPYMIEEGKHLAESGADIIAIPCITAHYFHHEFQKHIPVPVIHGIKEAADYIARHGIEKVGIMATDGTVHTDIFQKQLAEKNMQCIYPDEQCQSYVMDLIYKDVKAGRRADLNKLYAVRDHLAGRGAQIIFLGCTELSVIADEEELDGQFLDVMEVLARTCVKSLGRLKKDYDELI